MTDARRDTDSATTDSWEPLCLELLPAPEPLDVFRRLVQWPGCLFLDSAVSHPTLGRYSFVTADPSCWIDSRAQGSRAAFRSLQRIAKGWATRKIPELPPFQGGIGGLLGYELGSQWEPTVPRPAYDDLHTPEVACGVYDCVVAFDHDQQRAWLVSSGFPEPHPERRARRAAERLTIFRQRLALPTPSLTVPPPSLAAAPQLTGPCKPTPEQSWLGSNFSRHEYLRAVERSIGYIEAGDIFQVNLSQRLVCPAHDSPTRLFERLRQRNAATFSSYFDLGSAQIVSASPERFLRVSAGRVETRPIKGTRPRSCGPEADLYSAAALSESEKDRAENVMIVDLLRNDLARVCTADSVDVPQLCTLETYAYVQHLVSVVTGQLPPDRDTMDLIAAAFPGGSITGAPKVRAMQIISELERVTRGSYCGSLGYLGWNQDSDWNILIRTITATRGWWHFPVGGGIVADSDPETEYAETWHKAEGLLRALRD